MVLSRLIALVLTLRALLPYPQNIFFFLKFLSPWFFSTITTSLTARYSVTDQNILYEPHGFVICLLILTVLPTVVMFADSVNIGAGALELYSPQCKIFSSESPSTDTRASKSLAMSLWVLSPTPHSPTTRPVSAVACLTILQLESLSTAVTGSQFHRVSLYEMGFSLQLLQPHNTIADLDP